ncbi:MAG: hypothetical protein ACYSUQ_06615 [Planctomycetota bacterium]|jgi:hypothetical protein
MAATVGLLLGLVGLPGLIGCAPRAVDVDDPATRQMLSLLMPARIIVEPFTGLKSFDDDDQPDGLEVVLRPVDAFQDPVKIAGSLRVELYHFRPASGESKGRKIEQWDVPLSSLRDQETYWNRYTQMYEIPLELDLAAAEPADKYVIEITYNTPLGEHTVTEYVFEPPLPRESRLAAE